MNQAVTPFPGYNLRGLIFTYLESKGWEWSAEEESWTHPEYGSFYGESASSWAIHEQIEHEEGRKVPA